MAKEGLVWEIKNFSSLQSEKCYSVPVLIGDYKWRLCAYPKGKENVDSFALSLQVADFESLPSGWRRYANFRVTIVNKLDPKRSVRKESHHWFNQRSLNCEVPSMIPLTKLHDEKEGFMVNGELVIIAEVGVLEDIGRLDESEKAKEASSSLKKRKLKDEVVEESNDLLKEAKESMDVIRFQVLPSQVESVRRIFEKHPDVAVEFGAKNQCLRNGCMNFLLSIIETLCQPLEGLSNEDLAHLDMAVTYLKATGFEVDWLEQKVNQVIEKKEKEQSALVQLQNTEEVLRKMKKKCRELDVVAEEQKAELSATRAPLSLDDIV